MSTPTLTKLELTEKLAETYDLHKSDAKKFVEEFFDSIKEILVSGEHVKLSGFGNFVLRDKKERPGRNPRTLEAKIISARRVVTFHPGQKLRNDINVTAAG